MNRFNREAKRRRISDDLAKARAEFIQMEKVMAQIVQESPSGLPLPDGTVRILQAGAAVRLAFEKYQKAAGDYREFLCRVDGPEVDGPED